MGTEIYGVIDEDTTIGPEGNPWYVPYNLTVSENSTLTILPGTEIYITAAYTDDYSNFVASGNNEAVAKTINIYGSLVAVGTDSDSILFTRYPDYLDYRWGGIRIMNEHPENSRFEYCNINYSAFIHDNIEFGSCGISTKPGIIIKYCRFQDNYFCIRIFDYDIGEYLPSLIYGCSFYSTEDRFLYYGADRDDGILLQIEAPDEETVIAYCHFDSMGLDMRRGENYIINNSFRNILSNNIGLRVVDNHDFYGNGLYDSDAALSQITASVADFGIFRRNTFENMNREDRIFFIVSGYNNVSDNYFRDSYVDFHIEPDVRFYNNIAENSYIGVENIYEDTGRQEFNNNFFHNSVFDADADYGEHYLYNNVFCGENSSMRISVDGNNIYGFNNYFDWWCLRTTIYEEDIAYHYNNIYNDIDNYVEEHFYRTTFDFYNNFLTYNIPDFINDCGGNLEDMDIALAEVVIDTLTHSFSLADSSLCIDAGYADTTFCNWDYSYNFSPFDGDGDGVAVVDIGPVEYGSYFTIGYVKCTVTDPEGVPLDIIRGEVAGECVEYSDQEGVFVMALPEGTYNLILDSPFYVRDSLFVAVSVTDTSFVNMSLEASYPFVGDEETELPEAKVISNVLAYPNPFNPETKISFELSEPVDNVSVIVFNIKGQKVWEYKAENLDKGMHEIIWSGKNRSGRQVASGVYLYQIKAGECKKSAKMLILK